MTSQTRTKRVAEAATGTATMAAIYVRISDDDEGEEKGIVRQEEDCRKLAVQRGLTVTRVYRENDIGASEESRKRRPQYEQMIADAQAGLFSVIIADTSSRLTRRLMELEQQIKLSTDYGLIYVYVKSPIFNLNTADGQMVARILAAADAAEAKRISERVSRAAKQRAEAGRYHGGARRPFGFEVDGVTVRESEADVIRDASDAVLAGVSLREIARDLRVRDVPTVTGTAWSPSTVKDILIRPRNAGRMVHQGQDVGAAPWKPLVAPEAFAAVVARLTDPSRTAAASGPAQRYLGTGIIRCQCGSVMEVHGGTGRARRYRCKVWRAGDGTGVRHVTRDAVSVDRYLADLIVEGLSRPDAVSLFLPAGPAVDVHALRAEVKRLQGKLVQDAADYDDDLMDRAQFISKTKRNRAKVATIEAQLAAVSTVDPLAGIVGADDVRAVWESMSLGMQRKVLDRVMQVTIMPAGRGRGFDPRCVSVQWKEPAKHSV